MRRKNSIYDIEKQIIIDTFNTSKSLPEAFNKLGFPSNTTTYRFAHNFARDNDVRLPIANAEVRAASAKESGRKRSRRAIPNEEMFRERSPYTRQTLKTRALQEGFLEYKCYGSKCSESQVSLINWEGLVLQLEHKNGVGDDNRLENLELLCPNCHSLTLTFGGKRGALYENGAHGLCQSCNRPSRENLCPRCAPEKRAFTAVSIEGVAEDINHRGIAVVATDYDMHADNFRTAIRHRLRTILNDLIEGGVNLLPDGINDVNYYALSQIPQKKKVSYPLIEELIKDVANRGFVRVAETLNVSDKGLRKHMLSILGSTHPVFDVKARKQFRDSVL